MNRQLSLNIPLKINMKISGMYQDGTTFIKAMLKEKKQNGTLEKFGTYTYTNIKDLAALCTSYRQEQRKYK